MRIRDAEVADFPRIAEIYSYYVLNTVVSFEVEAPGAEEMRRRMESFRPYPYIVAEEDGKILGYAYAHKFAERAAYRRSAEVTIYLDRDVRRRGIGKALYAELEERLRAMGFVQRLYAIICYPGEGSVEFHSRMGYRIVGKLTDVGEKMGKLLSTVYMEKSL